MGSIFSYSTTRQFQNQVALTRLCTIARIALEKHENKMNNRFNESYTIWLDSDGVICDFNRLVSEYVGKPMDQITKGAVWRSIEEYDANVAPFFESLPKMRDADVLLDFVKSNFINYGVLTASGYVPKNGAQQKKRWYAKHYPDMVVKVVVKSPDKAAFALNDRCILIDDRRKSIDPWVAGGGTGILHTSAKDTIIQLKEMVGI